MATSSRFWASFACWVFLVGLVSLISNTGGISLQHGTDKIFHCLFYTPFALFAFYHPRRGTKSLMLVSLFGINFGLLMEILQRRVHGRSFEWLDFVADMTGVVLGLAVFGIWFAMKRRVECRRKRLLENTPAKF